MNVLVCLLNLPLMIGCCGVAFGVLAITKAKHASWSTMAVGLAVGPVTL